MTIDNTSFTLRKFELIRDGETPNRTDSCKWEHFSQTKTMSQMIPWPCRVIAGTNTADQSAVQKSHVSFLNKSNEAHVLFKMMALCLENKQDSTSHVTARSRRSVETSVYFQTSVESCFNRGMFFQVQYSFCDHQGASVLTL